MAAPRARLAAALLALGLAAGVARAELPPIPDDAAAQAASELAPAAVPAASDALPAAPDPAAPDPLIEAALSQDPATLRTLANELVRLGRVEEATRLLERAVTLERGATPPPPAPSRADSETLQTLRVQTMAVASVLFLALGTLLVLGLRALRPRGDLAVTIEFSAKRRGSFDVRLARKSDPEFGARHDAQGEVILPTPGRRASSAYEHTLVGRETQFRAVAARSYWVQIEGILEEPGPHGDVSAVYEEREVYVGRGEATRVEFDLRPKDCLVEVHVLRCGHPAPGAQVSLLGYPDSLRDAPEGAARFSLGFGSHRLAAGSEERVAVRSLEIDDLDPRVLTFDLDDQESLVFRSCETAVEPYLQSDFQAAANALERSGQRPVAHLLRAELHRSRREFEAAALQYEAAGKLLEAAEVYAESGAEARAAVLFERAGEADRAARMFLASGDQVRAGRAFEQAGDLAQAASCYRKAEAIPKLIDVLEKLGDHFEAGRLAFERNETPRAVRNLQQVDPRHPEYTQACRILAEHFVEQERVELAVQKADEAVTFANDEADSTELLNWYGNVLDQADRSDRALKVFQDLASRLPDDAAVKRRVGELEEKISKEQMRAAGTGGTTPPPKRKESQRYELLDEVGRGGMGVVFKARDRRLGRIVALKRLPDNLRHHPRAVELFLREARSAAALNHANIVTVHDVDQDDDGTYLLTMELLKGAPLNVILKKRGRLHSADAARLGVQIAAGLHYAHQRGIVHRDIKTANLFFTNEKIVKIMDFGLAKMLEEVRRASTQVTGTPYYMAPEQAIGVGVDHRADLYGFGVTLFELVTGTLPFTDGDIIFQHREAPPPNPREIVESIPVEFAELVLRLLAKSPEDRFADAGEVGERLQVLAGSPSSK